VTPCPRAPLETVAALWAGELGEPDATSFCEHIFSCDVCAARAERTAKLVGGLRALVPMVISAAHRDRLVAGGMRIHVTPVRAGVDGRARFAPDVDLLVHALAADLSAATRVDVEIVGPTGAPSLVFENVPFDRARGEVLIACQRHYEGMFDGDPLFQVHAVEAEARRQVGQYRVVHEWR
jgi:hypothetical protein